MVDPWYPDEGETFTKLSSDERLSGGTDGVYPTTLVKEIFTGETIADHISVPPEREGADVTFLDITIKVPRRAGPMYQHILREIVWKSCKTT